MGYNLACDLEQLYSKRTDSTAGGRGRILLQIEILSG